MIGPRENPELKGHGQAEARILEALRSGRLHHAWLISGPEGVGKATLAFRFARRLLAGGADTLEMDPSHPVFRRVAAGTHADLMTVEREWDEKKKRLKKTIAAESVREIPGFLHLTPAEGGWRAVIVDGAEDMNAFSANALLKVLEEPPSRAVLILVTAAPGRLLPTIRSRCRHLPLAALPDADLLCLLAERLPELDAADRASLAALAEGCPGRAFALAQGGGLAISAMVAEITGALPRFPLLRAYEMADRLREEDAFDTFFALLRRAIADAVTACARGNASAEQRHLAALRTPQAWGEAWSRLGALHADTFQHNLDKKQAVVAALSLLTSA